MPDPRIPTTVTALSALVGGRGGRAITVRRCRRCARVVLAGWDDDYCAMLATVEWVPLSAVGELVALLGGRPTYELRAGRPWTITRRWGRQITSHHPGTHDWRGCFDVVAAHRCNGPLLPDLPSQLPIDAHPPVGDGAQCPF